MSELFNLKPKKKYRIMDLVEKAGIDVSCWANCKGGEKKAASNPKYCYEWSFIQPGKVVVINLWHNSLVERNGMIVHHFDLRADANEREKIPNMAAVANRSRNLDNFIQAACRENLPIRIVVCDGERRKRDDPDSKASRVHKRLLDLVPWAVTAYDWDTGRGTLTRGVRPVSPDSGHKVPVRASHPIQTKIEIITDPHQITDCHTRFHKALLQNAEDRKNRSLGYQGGHMPATVYWRSDINLWMAFEEENNRFWNAFGLGDPNEKNTISIIAEINQPYEGIKRNIASAFGRDEDGVIYVLHRGKVGGGRIGIGKEAFIDQYKGSMEWVKDGNRKSRVIVIGELDKDELSQNVADFVKAVNRFKISTKEGTTSPSNGSASTPDPESESDRGFRQEFEGERILSTRERIRQDCRHGRVINVLQDILSQRGFQTRNDTHRDLIATDPNGKKYLFEAKKEADSYSIYTAIGQLAYHTVNEPEIIKVAVLPEHTSLGAIETLKRLGLEVLFYEWDQNQPIYPNLDAIL